MNKLIQYCVMAAVGVLVFSALLIPLVNEATATNTTFTNDGYYTMDKLDTDTNATIEWSKDSLNILTVNGVDIDMSEFVGVNRTSFTIIGSDYLVIRYEKTSDVVAGVQLYGTNGAYLSFHSNTAADAGDKLTISISEGTITCTTNGTTPLNRSYTITDEGYIINPNGTGIFAVMKYADTPAYVLEDSDIKLIGVSVAGGPNAIVLYGAGTIAGGMEISTVYKPESITAVSYSNITATDSAVNGYNGLYSLDKYEFTINYDNSTYNATYSYFIVPVEVTADKTVTADDSTRAVMGIIPVIVIVGLIAGIVGIVAVRRGA